MTAPVGIGLRQPHLAALLQQRPALGFVEVHSENYFGAGGAALAALEQVRQQFPVGLHGVGLALGSACGLDEDHLRQLAALVQRIQPLRVSDHACFARAVLPGSAHTVHAADLLPLAFTDAALNILVANVQHVQERLRQPLLVENLAAYVQWADSDMTEPEFFNQLVRRSGCSLLLDLNNLVVNARNSGADQSLAVAQACAWVDALDPRSVGQVHLAGHSALGDIVIDDHASAVPASVWAVFEHTLRRLGPVPTLVEWDNQLPALEVLTAQAQQAQALMAKPLLAYALLAPALLSASRPGAPAA